MGIMFLWLMCEKGKNSNNSEDTTTITTITEDIDTIFPPDVIIDLGNLKIPRSNGVTPEMLQHLLDGVYVDNEENRELRERIKFLEQNTDSLGHNLRQYKDTISDENIIIYTDNIVEGNLLFKDIDYKLKVPKEIIKTTTINTTETIFKSGLYLTTGLGGNKDQFSNINLGLTYVNTKNNVFGYEYNLMNNTHNVKVGFRILKK